MTKLNDIVVFLVFVTICQLSFSQNINTIFTDFDKTGMQSDILYNPSSISNINELKDKKHGLYSFYQVYKSIAFSDFQERLPDLENLKMIGLRPSKKIKVFNGKLECRFLRFDIYEGSKKSKQKSL